MKKIKILKIICTCNGFPAQFEGITKDDRPVYIRDRYHYCTIEVGEPGGPGGYDAIDGEEVFGSVTNGIVGEDEEVYQELKSLVLSKTDKIIFPDNLSSSRGIGGIISFEEFNKIFRN